MTLNDRELTRIMCSIVASRGIWNSVDELACMHYNNYSVGAYHSVLSVESIVNSLRLACYCSWHCNTRRDIVRSSHLASGLDHSHVTYTFMASRATSGRSNVIVWGRLSHQSLLWSVSLSFCGNELSACDQEVIGRVYRLHSFSYTSMVSPATICVRPI